MTVEQLDLLSAVALRDAGTALVDANEPTEWKAEADKAIALLARRTFASGGTFTAEDVREIAGDPERPNAMGARWLAAVRAGLVEQVGMTRSTRPESHRCRLFQYRGTRKAAS